MNELQLQAKCYQWAYGTFPQIRKLLWHVPNETKPYPGEPKRDFYIRLNHLKAAGLLPGCHDLHLFWKSVLYTFELKVDYNGQSPEQYAFGTAIVDQGGQTFEIRDLETFKTIFKQCLVV